MAVFSVAALSMASCIIVIIQSSFAFFSISLAEAFHSIRLSKDSSTFSTSCAPILHLYQVLLHSSHHSHLQKSISSALSGMTHSRKLSILSVRFFSFILYAFAQLGHILFISLCEITSLSAEEIRKGSIHMFISLWIVQDAEFVCIVESTKCQVSAASIASIAVSLSRISHTIMISGS